MLSSIWNLIVLNFFEELGTIASVIGAVTTIYYSRRAKSAAVAATLAATETRAVVSKLSMLAEFNEMIRQLEDIRRRLDTKNWELIADKCSNLRVLLSPITADNEEYFSSDVFSRLVELHAQIKNLEQTADKQHFGAKVEPNLARIRSILSDQKETLMIASAEINTKLGDADVN